jgi:phosphoribosylglycinamide formyltransferase-1
MEELRLALFASHNGSNIQEIINACKKKELHAIPCIIISNNSESKVLKRAKEERIPFRHLSSKTHPDLNDLDTEILETLKKYNVNLIILAGYMKKLGPKVLKNYKSRILNIHPALLPKYGGKGMYGNYIHEAVLQAKEKETGVTIHIVDEDYDTGRIINQIKVPVFESDTVEILSKRVLEQEHKIYVDTLNKIYEGKIKL